MNPFQPHLKRLWLACLAMASAGLFQPQAHAVIDNVAPNGIAYASGKIYANDPVWKLIDGDRSSQIHADTTPDLGLNYSLNLGKPQSIQKLTVYPRQDGCCPDRLRNFRLSIHNDDGGVIGTEVWGTDLLTGAGENAGSGAGKSLSVDVPSQTGQWIKIEALENPVPDYALQITELEVFADITPAEVNRAINTLVTVQAGPLYQGQVASSLVDGVRSSLAHGVQAPVTGFGYTINLGGVVKFSSVLIYPRQDGCCPERLSNYRVSIHKDLAGQPGPALWTADLHTDLSNPGSDWGSKDELVAALDPAGSFEGQYIVIQSLDDPLPEYALQISEVMAFGEPQGATSLLISGQPSATSTALGLTATFSVTASAVNGDPTKITYQWQRNGVDISGANSPTLVTAPALFDDDKSKYRCVISYPGAASVTSDEAELRLNRAQQTKAFTNRPLWANGGWNISQIVDGNRNDALHGDATIETGFSYQIDLGAEVKVEEIRIYPRQDGCCPERLRNIRVSLHKDSGGSIGDSTWFADLYTQDGENAGSGKGVVTVIKSDLDPAGSFQGQWLEILNIEDPVTPYALQMTEVEVFGSYTSAQPILNFVSVPPVATGVPGRPVNLPVVAKVINGDPAKITYRWTRDGTTLPDSNTNSFRTAPLVDADTNSIFRCIISYPGIADVTSDPIQIVFDYNYARSQPASSNRPLWGPGGWNISQIADGDRLNTVHGDTAIEVGFAYTINLGINIQLDHLDIYPRQDGCCPDRLKNLHVSLHKDNNGEIGLESWGADILTDSNAGSGAGVVVTVRPEEGSGDAQGSWIQILALDDPIPDYFLQLTEIEVYGLPTGGPARPVLVFERKPTGIELRWTTGALEGAANISGPWSPIANATSPFLAPTAGSQRFFRLNQ